MVSTSGSTLLPEDAVKTLCKDLLPRTTLLTPNIAEAQLLLKETGHEEIQVTDRESLEQLAKALHRLGPKHVLVKGGHLPLAADGKAVAASEDAKYVANVLFDGTKLDVITSPHRASKNTHGTGCSLACKSKDDVQVA